jgi:prevent-host-death family protein
MEEKPRSAVKTINAMKARQNFGEMLEQVYYRGDRFIIERAGKPMAAVVPLSQLEQLQKHSGPTRTEHDTIKGHKRRVNKRRT